MSASSAPAAACALPAPGAAEDFGQRLPRPPLQVLDDEPLSAGARRAQLLALLRSLKLHEV